MAEFPALPLWTDAYLGDTTHLTTIEHGAYLLLLISMWRAGGTLPDDDRLLAKYVHTTPAQWARISTNVRPFFKAAEGRISQGRLSDELKAVKQNSKRQSDRVKARWLKTKYTGGTAVIPDAYRNDTTLPLPLTSKIKEEEAKASFKKKAVGTRLPMDWFLPKDWGDWAVSQGWIEDDIRDQADRFRDHWHGKSGANATKLNWLATWRNWLRVAKDRKPKLTAINGGINDRLKFDVTHREYARRLSAGEINPRPDPSDPFAGR